MADIKDKIIELFDILRRRDVAAKEAFGAKAYKKAIDELKILDNSCYRWTGGG